MSDLFAGYGTAIEIVAIMIAIAGIVLGIGYALNDRKIKELGGGELFQSMVNGAIIGVLFLAFGKFGVVTLAINGIVGNQTQGTQCDPMMQINSALCFASVYLTSTGTPVYLNGNTILSLTSASVDLLLPLGIANGILAAVGEFGRDFGVGAALLPVTAPMGYAIKALAGALMALQVQGMLLRVIAATSTTILLPIGLALRAFYPTRSLGGTLVAVAIGFFAVFPLTYVLDAQLAATTWNTSLNSTVSEMNTNVQNLQTNINSALGQPSNSILGPVIGAVTGFTSAIYISGEIQAILSAVALLIVQVFFFPIFSLILTIISIRELARILGSEITFAHFDVF